LKIYYIDCLKRTKRVIQHFNKMMLFLNYPICSGTAETLVRCGRIL